VTALPYPQPDGGNASAPPPARRSRAGMIVLIVGAVILLGSIAAGVVLAVVGFGGIADDTAKNEILSGGQGVITLEEGEARSLYAEAGQPTPECTVLDPTGAPPQDGGIQSSTITYDGTSWSSFENFRAGAAGEYQVSCGATVMVGPPVSIGGIFAGVGGILAAVFGGAFGLLLVVIGLVLHFALKRKA